MKAPNGRVLYPPTRSAIPDGRRRYNSTRSSSNWSIEIGQRRQENFSRQGFQRLARENPATQAKEGSEETQVVTAGSEFRRVDVQVPTHSVRAHFVERGGPFLPESLKPRARALL